MWKTAALILLAENNEEARHAAIQEAKKRLPNNYSVIDSMAFLPEKFHVVYCDVLAGLRNRRIDRVILVWQLETFGLADIPADAIANVLTFFFEVGPTVFAAKFGSPEIQPHHLPLDHEWGGDGDP